MRYLTTNDIEKIGIDWDETIETIQKAVSCLKSNQFSQPVKPYVRFNEAANRIIAMPAYVGPPFCIAGIKWIASFPENINKNLARAHSVTILNDADTGVPLCTINTGLISGIRTASVSGLVIKKIVPLKNNEKLNIGIIGFGPIGRLHLSMIADVLSENIGQVFLYDQQGIIEEYIPSTIKEYVTICKNWEDAYVEADIFITCTTSKERYINKKPKERSLLLNVSLRDFTTDIYDYMPTVIVDDWEEVCRENTDIEMMYLNKGLNKEDSFSIIDLCSDQIPEHKLNNIIMFNPMGMAVFDIAIGSYYYQQAAKLELGHVLS